MLKRVPLTFISDGARCRGPSPHGRRLGPMLKSTHNPLHETTGALGGADTCASIYPSQKGSPLEPPSAIRQEPDDGRRRGLALAFEEDCGCREGNPSLERPPSAKLVESPECAEGVVDTPGQR
jgi:hypothetical protein